MRALLATAGLLVLAGSALAGRPTAHTLRKSAGGPIEAIAQDNNLAAWFASGTRPCNEVHVMSPGKKDRSVPPPSSDSMTCNWDITGGQSQLAIAGRMSTALWTLHETGPSSFDQVVAASFGGPERQLERFTHATNGIGDWLGGVAGAGKTLAYSWIDVEYVDPVACLSGASCKEKLADGGIRVVERQGTKYTYSPLPGAKPALQVAAAAGRIAYVPALTVKSGRPSANTNSPIYIVDADNGDPVGQAFVRGIPIAIALSSRVLAVLTTQDGPYDRISWFSATDGTRLGSTLVSALAAPQLAANKRAIVYRVGHVLRDVSTRNGRIRKLAQTGQNWVGLSLAHNRLIWAENHNHTGRLRTLTVG
ncbi:MAG TPA: hypothetical protein VGK62_00610 [Gaiellaceae bacterium]